MSEQLLDLFNFSKAKILVVGRLMLDTYWFGTTNRTSPEAPVAIAHYTHADNRLAGSGLIAAIIKKLGASVDLISSLGLDNDGVSSWSGPELNMSNTEINNTIKELLASHQISKDNLVTHSQRTPQRIRVVSQAQQLLRIDNVKPSESTVDSSEAVNQKFLELYKNYNIIIFYDNLIHDYQTCYQLAKKNHSKIIYIPSSTECLNNFIDNNHRADYIITEQNIQNIIDARDALAACDVALLNSHEEGITLYNKPNQEITKIKAIDCSVINTIGNLEMLSAVFALGLSTLGEIHDGFVNAAQIANAAMGFAVRQFGQCTIDIVELQLAYADYILNSKYNYINLKQEITAAREKKQKIVFANGCFDVLHMGHVAYLEEAKARGDKLFIAINSDCSIKRLKGDSRPINKLEDRLLVLKSLDLQDWVVPFYTDTPEDFLRWLKPDLLVKGGDYTPDQIVGHEIVHSYGGNTEIIKHNYNNISSSKILADTTQEHV